LWCFFDSFFTAQIACTASYEVQKNRNPQEGRRFCGIVKADARSRNLSAALEVNTIMSKGQNAGKGTEKEAACRPRKRGLTKRTKKMTQNEIQITHIQ
jgi:hypothetical protein